VSINKPFAIRIAFPIIAVLLAMVPGWAVSESLGPTIILPTQFAQSTVARPPSPGSTEQTGAEPMPVFEPPPVPAFMLRKPAQPLSLQEMDRQAEEAAARARRAREGATGALPPPEGK